MSDDMLTPDEVREAEAGEPPADRPRAPIEHRTASIADTNESQRLVTVVVTPYEEPATVMWRDELWNELFERGAWDRLAHTHPGRIRANRGHDKNRTCGKAMKFFPSRQEGLVAEVRMAQTALGDETLQLCVEDNISVSAGFGALPSDQVIDRSNRTRRIKSAYMDHISFVEDPAYTGARVLEVRENEIVIPDDQANRIFSGTPLLDEFMNDPTFMQLLNRSKQ